mmetsp:Transcript_62045/g.146985  ORF Transcript_62045/g.146985 Transcript_62045/m.146985 type:complete len:188 (+) Transcript_62045:272-835(+)
MPDERLAMALAAAGGIGDDVLDDGVGPPTAGQVGDDGLVAARHQHAIDKPAKVPQPRVAEHGAHRLGRGRRVTRVQVLVERDQGVGIAEAQVAQNERRHHLTSSFIVFAMKARMSLRSSMILAVGLPAPWPALVSMRISLGAGPVSAACSVAAYLKLCAGTTRSSWSPVVMSTAGYLTPLLMLCSGE